MHNRNNKITHLQDYTPPTHLVTTVDLRFELDENATRIHSGLMLKRNPVATGTNFPLELNAENISIESVHLDGRKLDKNEYRHEGSRLVIDSVPAEFRLEIVNTVNPSANTELEGLYLSSGNFCTQCEAEGFRKITPYPDRPDVMAEFTTTIIADRDRYPVLLANGNLVDEGIMDDGRHYAVWHDPFKKPCYLFALVAGKLVRIEDTFHTRSGRQVGLHIYVEPRNREKCDHAMQSLKKAMQWDEEMFGLEYDLDVYMIVAVDDFNMGAMENKGLNVFNSKYVLARPETATDADYEGIEGVIAHEYFHNWTGNRITCRDWFQLSLKEGLTVFRDQEFSADMTSRPVKRIHDVQVIRNFQFREDAGPMAHPVRPDSYLEINNFYTLTVYDKGAEVIRMLHTFLGRDGFRKGMDLYFARHDGQAVTCDDFFAAMTDANDIDLDGFKRWYSQAGTPVLQVTENYDTELREYHLHLEQHTPTTPGQENKEPLLMPVRMGLLDSRGNDLPLQRQGHDDTRSDSLVLHFGATAKTYTFVDIPEKPVLSVLRDFSAPVRLSMERDDSELAFLMAHDSDSFNRWDAGQQLSLKYILEQIKICRQGGELQVPAMYQASFRELLNDRRADPAFVALALNLPLENWIGEQLEVIDPEAIFQVLQFFRHHLAVSLREDFLQVYQENITSGPYRYTSEEAGHRSLKNTCLAYLLTPDPQGNFDGNILDIAVEQYRQADNMTDKIAALKAVVNCDREQGDELLENFYRHWKDDPLVVDKWLTLQALCPLPGTLERVISLTGHPAFVLKNPNKVRALIGAFCHSNHVRFHNPEGRGYAFLTDHVIALNSMNPQIAARLLTPLTTWRRYDGNRQQLMRTQLKRVLATDGLSADVAEVAGKSLD